MPVKDSFYDKLGRGIANVAFSVSEPFDSQYGMIDTEGNTTAFCKGFLVQGISRMLMDMGHGVFEIVTSPFPTNNGSYRQPEIAALRFDGGQSVSSRGSDELVLRPVAADSPFSFQRSFRFTSINSTADSVPVLSRGGYR